jgi:hypothetical protein
VSAVTVESRHQVVVEDITLLLLSSSQVLPPGPERALTQMGGRQYRESVDLLKAGLHQARRPIRDMISYR